MKWNSKSHSANYTDDYIFNQLIPYIGNKRKLLGLIQKAIDYSGINPSTATFIDAFSGTGVVSRYAKSQGFRVISNDWEPYSETINQCYISGESSPTFFDNKSYEDTLNILNNLEPIEGWITKYLCPDDDDDYDIERDRMFYMRKNGMRIDAIREKILEWDKDGKLNTYQKSALLAPLLYQCCYNSNTSGVFKGFHNGWGGKTGTALYRIKGDLKLRPATFVANNKANKVFREDVSTLVSKLKPMLKNEESFIYLDPPYNQHPYGSNYHVLNSVALWDKPLLSHKIEGRGTKSAIRTDWRTERRSLYNHRNEASRAYYDLLSSIERGWVATSYSTDGFIGLHDIVKANHDVGNVHVFTQGYKRYRVSSQRFSEKPMNIEFILLTKVGEKPRKSIDEIVASIAGAEARIIATHPETSNKQLRMEIA